MEQHDWVIIFPDCLWQRSSWWKGGDILAWTDPSVAVDDFILKGQTGSLGPPSLTWKRTTWYSKKHQRRKRFAEVQKNKKKKKEKRRGSRCSFSKARTMLFSPTSLTECVREWDDLEKNYQQIQVNEPARKLTCACAKLTVTVTVGPALHHKHNIIEIIKSLKLTGSKFQKNNL